jgi:hypothetical protein
MSETPNPSVDLNTRFQRLFRDGKLLQVHVRKWSMSTCLNEEDLPLVTGSKLPEFFKLGNKMLIDEKEMKKFISIESAARNYLRAHALPFPIAQANFVPTKVLLSVLEKLEEFRTKYNTAVGAFVANYEIHKEAMLTKHAAHRTILEPYYPPAGQVREKFGFHIGMFEVAFPQQMKEIDLAAVQAEATARSDMQHKFEAEWQRQYAQSLEQVDGFLKEAVTSMRSRVVEVFETIARKIQNREVVSATNLKTMGSIIEAFDGLDFLDDKTVRTKLEAVKGLITSGRDFKGDYEAIDLLTAAVGDVLTVARETTDLDALTGEYVRRIEV